MSRVAVKQPDGLYAIWSTVVNDFIVYDATAEDIDQFIVQEAIIKAQQAAMEMIAQAEMSSKEQFTYKLSNRGRVHGDAVTGDDEWVDDYKNWLAKWRHMELED